MVHALTPSRPHARCRDVFAGHIEGRVDDQNRSLSQYPPIPPEWSNLMTEPAPRIDFANLPTPAEGFLVTLFITVRNVARSREFYSRVLGGTVVLEENPCIVKLPIRGS